MIYVADTNNNAIRRIATNGTVTTYAGSLTGASGSTDAIGTAATFAQPRGIAVDGFGVVYVADTSNHTIREISTGTQTVTTLAGTAGVAAFLDGTGPAARFNTPAGLSVDDAGNVIVADCDNHRIRQITPAGVVTTIAGEGNAFRDDGPVATASFNFPEGVVANSCGDIFVADTANNSIRKISAGNVVTVAGSTAGATGSTDASGTTARFFRPLGIATYRLQHAVPRGLEQQHDPADRLVRQLPRNHARWQRGRQGVRRRRGAGCALQRRARRGDRQRGQLHHR